MYTDLYTKPRRPFFQPVLMVFAILSIAGAAFVYTTQYSPSTKASTGGTIIHDVVNVTSKQVSVFWESDEPETGWVLYGESPEELKTIATNDKSKDSKAKYRLHMATLKNLEPGKQYYYKIISNNVTYSDIDGAAYSFKTPENALPSSFSQPAYGKITLSSGKAAEGVMVKIYIENAVPVFTISKPSGEWLAPLQNVYSKDLKGTVQLNESTKLRIEMVDEQLNDTTIQSTVQKSSPVPQTIILGTDYDFTKDDNVLPASTSREEEATQEIAILFPKQDAIIPGTKPLMKGTAIPNSRIQLQLDTKPMFRSSALVNERGEWMVTVPKPLRAGTYTVTLIAKDIESQDVVLTRSFTLLKSGEQVLAEATGPAALTPSLSPTVGVTLSPTVALSPTRIASASPTIRLSPYPTASAAPSTIYVTPAPPVSGSNGIVYTVIAVGMLIIGGGVMLLL